MYLTNALLKKAKSKTVLVLIKSTVSGHTYRMVRERLADKMEVVKFDPQVQAAVLFREERKIRSLK